MDKDYVLSVAQEIRNQIIGLTEENVFLSWGVSQWTATVHDGMPALRMKVNGFNTPDGYCTVALDEGEDYYKIFIKDCKGKVTMVAESIDFTQLPDVLDRFIERGDDRAAYERFCLKERERLLNELFG